MFDVTNMSYCVSLFKGTWNFPIRSSHPGCHHCVSMTSTGSSHADRAETR